MAYAHVAPAIEYALIRENAVRRDQIVDQLRIDWSGGRRRGLSGNRAIGEKGGHDRYREQHCSPAARVMQLPLHGQLQK
jgi:hypothetical protein